MRKKCKSVALVLSFAIIGSNITVVAAEENDSNTESSEDELDLSKDKEKVDELGIPTVSSVQKLKSEADALYESKDYMKAAEAYSLYAKNVNWLANIISGTLEPYYSADYDDRKDWKPESIDVTTLYMAESESNHYKSERNRAMLYEGLCYYYENDYETAIPLLLKALDLIEIDDETNWQLGYDAVMDIVENN